jgi:GTPase Era involved in 16S rRNA processing
MQLATEMIENYLFLGNPGTGKSTLINCLIGQRVFESGLSYGEGLTQVFQRFAHNGTVFMDTPGLADCTAKEKAAAAITKALRQGGTFKLFFMVRLESGRVVSDDLATIETVLASIDMKDVPFSVVVNNVKKRQYTAMMSKGAEFFKVVALINSCKYTTPFLTFIPTLPSLDEMDNTVVRLPYDAEKFFRCDACSCHPSPLCQSAQTDQLHDARR